jgi:Ribbon-helix-helix protein, copG family
VFHRLYPVILTTVKTAISIPDATFERATHKAQALGMSRSEFFTRAATKYLDELDAASVTDQIDHVLAALDGGDDSMRAAIATGRRLLAGQDEDW